MTNIFSLPTVEFFDHEGYHCEIKHLEPFDWPGSIETFYPVWRHLPNGKRWGRGQGFGGTPDWSKTREGVRALLIDEIIPAEQQKAAERKEKALATRQRRLEQRIAKIAREYVLGKFIGNLTRCAICNRALSDPASVERGIGSECWPRLLDRLALQVPRCEEEIEGYRKEIAELKGRDAAYWHARYPHDPSSAEWRLRNTLSEIKRSEQKLADTEALLAAAQRWNAPAH